MDPLIVIAELEAFLAPLPLVVQGGLAGLFVALFTGMGALPVLFGTRITRRVQDGMLGFAAGVMLAATAFSLVLPAVDYGTAIYGHAVLAVVIAATGILAGSAGIAMLHRIAPHEHFIKGREGTDTLQLQRLWLFVIAIALHNFPEGLAVGVVFGGDDLGKGLALTLGIAIQNLPEGLAVAVALASVGYSRLTAVSVAALTGLVELVGSILGAAAVGIAAPALPIGLAFAGGAMLFVISNEIIPETHRNGSAHVATPWLMIGFVVMMMLDVLLG